MFKRYLLPLALLTLAALTLGLTACSKPVANEMKPLNIGSMPTQTASIYAVGIEKGFFKKNGLDVTLTVFNSAVERDAAATAGKVDGFLTDIMGAVNLKEHGFNFTITSSEYENFSLLTGPKGTAVAPADLKGQKIGIANNTVTEFFADQALEGVSAEKINVPKVPERLAALMSNNTQAAVFPEPFTSIIKSKGGHPVASSADMGLQPVVFVFSSKLIQDQPKTVENFYKAYNETVAYMKKTPYDDYKAVLLAHKLVKPELVDLVKLPLDHYGNAKMVGEQDVSTVLLWMKGKSMVKNDYSYKDLVDAQFAK